MARKRNTPKARSKGGMIDLIGLFALADKAHASERAMWRGFLGYFLSSIFEIPAQMIERLVATSVSASPEELQGNLENPKSVGGRCAQISAELAQLLDLPLELGFAAFLESNLPTRAYPVARRSERVSDEKVTADWLHRLEGIRTDEIFTAMLYRWQKTLQFCMDELNEVVDVQIRGELVDEDVNQSA